MNADSFVAVTDSLQADKIPFFKELGQRFTEGMSESSLAFFNWLLTYGLPLALTFVILLVTWRIFGDTKDKDTAQQKALPWEIAGGLIILVWLIFAGGGLDFNFKFPFVKIVTSLAVGFGTGFLAWQQARSKFFLDRRKVEKGKEPTSPPPRPYWPGLISVIGCGIILMLMPWVESKITLGYWFMAFYLLGCLLIVPMKQRWILTLFAKPIGFIDPTGKEEDGKKQITDVRKRQMQAQPKSKLRVHSVGVSICRLSGWFWWLPVPIWVSFFTIKMLTHASIERPGTSPWVTTKTKASDQASGAIVGGRVRARFRLTIYTNVYPERFLVLDDEDQADIVGVALDITSGWLTDHYQQLTMDEFRRWKPNPNPEIITELQDNLLFSKKELRKAWDKLAKLISERLGAQLIGLQFLDPDLDPIVEKEANLLAGAEAAAKRLPIEGRAEGDKLAAEIDGVLVGLGINPKTASPEERLMALKQIQQTAESKQSRHVVPRGSDATVIADTGSSRD